MVLRYKYKVITKGVVLFTHVTWRHLIHNINGNFQVTLCLPKPTEFLTKLIYFLKSNPPNRFPLK